MYTRDWTGHLADDGQATTGTPASAMNGTQVPCTSGHANSPGASFCSTCGEPLVPPMEPERPAGPAGSVPPPPRSEWAGMPPPPPRSFRADAPPPRSPGAAAPAGIFGRLAAYWRRSSPRRKLVISLVAVVLVAAIGAAARSHGPGPVPGVYSSADESAFMSQCVSGGYSQSMCGCALGNVEQTLSPSLFHEAMTAPTTEYEGVFNAAERACGM